MFKEIEKYRAKIIWIDDEIDLLKSHILFLENKGYSLTTFNSPKDALEELKVKDFDIVLLDENMQGMSGIDVLKIIKSHYKYLPVIMITKNEEEWLMDEAIGYNADNFLTKPVNPSQILLACKDILDASKIWNDKITEKYLNDFQLLNNKIHNINNINDWFAINNILCEWIINIENMNDKNLISIFNDQYAEANKLFSNFIIKNYKNWMNIDNHNPNMSNVIIKKYIQPFLSNNEKVIFIVLDCLSFDIWKKISEKLFKFYKIDTQNSLSILPTTTAFARNSIFSGLFPSEIYKKYPLEWDKMWNNEKSKNIYEEFFVKELLKNLGLFEKKINYKKIVTLDQGKELIKRMNEYKGCDLFSVVINFIDILGHSRTESNVIKEIINDRVSYRSAVCNWFENSWLYEFLKEASYWNHKVIITSDHGMLQVKKPVLVKGDKNTSTGVRSKYGRNLNLSNKKGLEIKHPSDYNLPDFDGLTNYIIAKNSNFFVYPNDSVSYVKNFKNSFQHGGISLEEMIVPVAILKGKKIEKGY
ncbi:MAG: two-component system response regulator [Candidatus Marinimicrobia bacterium]|nr:two-component system response regulator [Candidatus Neomarinimicrobiota bacterium]